MMPAVYSNRFYIRINSDGIVRLDFREKIDADENERSAVALTLDDAKQLAAVLQDTISRSYVSAGSALTRAQ